MSAWRELKNWWDMRVNRVSEMAASSSFAYSVWHLSLMQFIWGLWLVLPNGTFEGEAFSTMELLAGAFTWGLTAMVIGAAKMHFVIEKKTISLALLCMATGYIWILVGVSFLFSVPANTGGVVYIMLGLYEFWLYKRLSSKERRVK